MPECVENIVNIWFSLDFQFWESWRFGCPGGGFGCHLGGFLVTLGSLFLVFFGSPKEVGISMDFQGFPGDPRSEATHPLGGNGPVQGGTQQPDCKLQGYKTTKIQDYKITGLQA